MKLHKYDQISSTPLEYIVKTAAEAIVPGEGLVITSGAATKVAATATPTYISQGKSAATDTASIPVIRVNPDMIFAAPLSADGAALVVGSTVTIHTDGVSVTATTTNGVFEIVGFSTSAQAIGDEVYGRFA